MIGKLVNMSLALVDMALASWERALTPDPKKFEYTASMHAALAGMVELQRQIELIRTNGGVRFTFRLEEPDNLG